MRILLISILTVFAAQASAQAVKVENTSATQDKSHTSEAPEETAARDCADCYIHSTNTDRHNETQIAAADRVEDALSGNPKPGGLKPLQFHKSRKTK